MPEEGREKTALEKESDRLVAGSLESAIISNASISAGNWVV